MKRWFWTIPVLVLSFLLMLPAWGDAQAAEKIKWRFPLSWGTGFRLFSDIGERIVDNVNTMADGQLELELFWAGELVPGGQVLDAVSSGAARPAGHRQFTIKAKTLPWEPWLKSPSVPSLRRIWAGTFSAGV